MSALVLSLLLTAAPDHIAAARVAGTTYRIEPELLLAIAEHETSWNAELVNGHACGPMQVIATSPAHCAVMSDPLLGYLEGARVLRYFLDVARGDLRPGLRGYGCGWAKDELGEVIRPAQLPTSCNGFDSWVIAHRNAYRREASS